MAGKGAETAFKLATIAGTVVAGIAARKVVSGTWKLAAGHEPPANPEDPEVTWQEALGFALLSGAAIGLARMLASRQTAAWFKRATGELPSNIRKASA